MDLTNTTWVACCPSAFPHAVQLVPCCCAPRQSRQDTAPGGAKSELVRITSQLLHKYYDHLEKRLGKARATGGGLV